MNKFSSSNGQSNNNSNNNNNNNNNNNGFVQSNSVQAQFTTLSREREHFHRAKEEADANHQRIQARVMQLKQEQNELNNKIRTIQEELGTLTRKQTMLRQEQSRVDRVLHCERKALEDCALHTQNLEQEERKRVKEFCGEIGELNDEIADLLQRQINARTEVLLSVETVEELIVEKLSKINSTVVVVDPDEFEEKLSLMKEANEIWKGTIRRYFDSLQKTNAANEENMSNCDTDSYMNHVHGEDGAPSGSQQMELFYGPDDQNEMME